MNTCKHCHQPIMEFTFTEGKAWTHMPAGWPSPMDNIVRQLCRGRITKAEPE